MPRKRISNHTARLFCNQWLDSRGLTAISSAVSHQQFAEEFRRQVMGGKESLPFGHRSEAVYYIRLFMERHREEFYDRHMGGWHDMGRRGDINWGHDMDERWFLIITQPNKESDACWHLRRQHYATFYPRRWHTWSRDRLTTSELRPYFPGYLFAAIVDHEHQSVGQIRDTIGVAAIRYENGEAYQLPRETMFNLRRGFDPDGVAPMPPSTARHMRVMLRGIPGAIRDELLAVVERISDRGAIRIGRGGRQQRKRLVDLVGEPVGIAA